ncbi:DUF2511 domain-containing protein [Streptomyces sp. P1-3]|uniref:DUF2511 domain-containing protein n=1 Tax=Streptomyces sp. P1-3 TaxID=3421658 RepID=UPI003D35E4F0
MLDETRQPKKAGTAIAGGFLMLMLILAFAQSCSTPDATPSEDPTASSTSSDNEDSFDDASAGTHSIRVTDARFDKWPFTVDAGTLRCRDGASVTFEADGTEYGVNGTAQDAGYPSVKPVWADDPALGHGLKVDISEVLNYGLSLC